MSQYIEIAPMSETVQQYLLSLVIDCLNDDEPWRYSALGILQKFPTKDLRVNIWDIRLRSPDIEWAGLVHSHKFEMTSYCVFGALQQTICDISDDGPLSLYRDNQLERYSVRLINRYSEKIEAGNLYHQYRLAIHRSDPSPLAVTVIHWKGLLERDLTVCLKDKGFTHKLYNPGDLAIAKTLKEVRDQLGC